MPEPTKDDIDALVGPATPHFAFQLRARVRALISDLPEDHPVRLYGEEQMDAARAARLRDLEGRGGPSRALHAHRLGPASEPRARVGTTPPKKP